MKIHVITRSTRLQNLRTVKESVFKNIPQGMDIEWHVVFDTATLKDIDAELLSDLKDNSTNYYFEKGDAVGMLYPQCSNIISNLEGGWVYFADDDNIIHDGFYEYVLKMSNENPDKKVHVVSQSVDGKDFTGLQYRLAASQFMKVGGVDLAQYIVSIDVYNEYGYKFLPDYCADGILINKVYREHADIITL